MSKLGKLLQQTRRKKKLTIDKVCDLTKMTKAHIYALESTNVKAFPAEMYYKSFLRTYAQILELDEKEIIRMYEQEKQEDAQGDLFSFAQEQQKKQEQDIKEIKVKKKQENKSKQENIKKDDTKKYLIIILSIVFVLLVVFSLIFFKQKNNNLIDNNAQVNPQQQNNVQQKQNLVIQTTMDTWIKIIADYQKIFEDTIPANTKKEFFADDNFVVKIGNVDGATVYFNGNLVDITTNVTPNRTKILTLKKENNLEK